MQVCNLYVNFGFWVYLLIWVDSSYSFSLTDQLTLLIDNIYHIDALLVSVKNKNNNSHKSSSSTRAESGPPHMAETSAERHQEPLADLPHEWTYWSWNAIGCWSYRFSKGSVFLDWIFYSGSECVTNFKIIIFI